MLTYAKCACKTCNVVLPVRQMIRMDKNDRGGANSYLCDFHAFSNESYGYEHNRTWGLQKAHGFRYGVELESMVDSIKARNELSSRDWIATSDCTVEVEFKSPIMLGLNALSKDCTQIELMNNHNELDTLDDDCGTHLNISQGDAINAQTVDYLRRFIHSLFVPLSDYLSDHPTAAKKVFGRAFAYYARPITPMTNATEHGIFINLEHDNRIEFRLCKFITAKQYMNCAKMCTEMMTALINNFIKHFNDEPKDSRRYATKTAYRKHKAEVTAAKLVKIFQKYEAKM